VCTVLELLMMGGETARNMYSIDTKKEYCITLHLVGCIKKNTLTMHDHMNVKGKAIPLHDWSGPEGSWRLKLPDFKTIGT
jgi:hypothetical protein